MAAPVPTTASTPMVQACGLRKAFGRTRALADVDLTVSPGEVVALLGPNGAGKTTLVRVLATLLEPDAGWARVAGCDAVRDPAAVRSLIGLTGQYAAVDDLLTGRENLEMVGELCHLGRAESRRRARIELDRFGLTDATDRLVKTYSGGMRRRLDLAASLIARPPVLVLDEPTTGLDPRTRLGMWESIEDLVSTGTTVLLTTQYLEEADRLADRIVVLDAGRVVAEGTADELKERVGGDVVEVRVSHQDELDRAFDVATALVDGEVSVDRARQRLTLPAARGSATLRSAFDRLDRAGVEVAEVGIRRPSLDQVFLALTGRATQADDAGPTSRGATADPSNRASGEHRAPAKHTAPDASSGSPTDATTDHDRDTDTDTDTGTTRRATDPSTAPETAPPPNSSAESPLTHGVARRPSRPNPRTAATDVTVLVGRNLRRIVRTPRLLLVSSVQPVLFALLFRYVFGGAIRVPGMSYVDYLVPGIFVQATLFGATTAVALAADLSSGMLERFRSLPIARSSVLTARSLADLVRSVGVVVLLIAVSTTVGFRFHNGVLPSAAGVGLVLAFGYAFTWLFAWIGLTVRDPETAQIAGLLPLFPFIFASSAFVPIDTMPGWLQSFARVQPVSVTVDAVRALTQGGPVFHWLWQSLAWILGFLIVLIPASVRRYRRS